MLLYIKQLFIFAKDFLQNIETKAETRLRSFQLQAEQIFEILSKSGNSLHLFDTAYSILIVSI